MHGKLSISLLRRGIFARSWNWNGAIPIPQVYLNLGSALCRLDPPSLRLLLLHFSAIAPSAVVPRSPSVRHGRHFWRERGRRRPTAAAAAAVLLGEISNLYSAHQSDSSCRQRNKRKKRVFQRMIPRQTEEHKPKAGNRLGGSLIKFHRELCRLPQVSLIFDMKFWT